MASKLYVIFHGAWAFVDNLNPDDGFIYAYAPQISGHVYKAGSWCQEKDIPQGAQLALTVSPVPQTSTVPCSLGASGDTIWNHGDRMLLFPMQCRLPAGASYVRVKLPRPATIYPEMYYRGLQVRFETAASAVAAPISLVPVFGYTLDAEPAPVLKNDGDGTTFWAPVPGDDIATLHFFAAEETDSGSPSQDFNTVAALLGYPQAALLKASPNNRCEQLMDIPDLAGREFEITTFLFQRACCPGPSVSNGQRGAAGPIAMNLDLASCGGGGGGS
ncbi:MAG TPA: hypothetical protein VFT88_14665 [Acidobacteriaceae bacterium]|nr:hypothetical protein [Acidobacteriaceae bacterium]